MKKGKFSKITLTFTLVAAMLLGCAAACSGLADGRTNACALLSGAGATPSPPLHKKNVRQHRATASAAHRPMVRQRPRCSARRRSAAWRAERRLLFIVYRSFMFLLYMLTARERTMRGALSLCV